MAVNPLHDHLVVAHTKDVIARFLVLRGASLLAQEVQLIATTEFVTKVVKRRIRRRIRPGFKIDRAEERRLHELLGEIKAKQKDAARRLRAQGQTPKPIAGQREEVG